MSHEPSPTLVSSAVPSAIRQRKLSSLDAPPPLLATRGGSSGYPATPSNGITTLSSSIATLPKSSQSSSGVMLPHAAGSGVAGDAAAGAARTAWENGSCSSRSDAVEDEEYPLGSNSMRMRVGGNSDPHSSRSGRRLCSPTAAALFSSVGAPSYPLPRDRTPIQVPANTPALDHVVVDPSQPTQPPSDALLCFPLDVATTPRCLNTTAPPSAGASYSSGLFGGGDSTHRHCRGNSGGTHPWSGESTAPFTGSHNGSLLSTTAGEGLAHRLSSGVVPSTSSSSSSFSDRAGADGAGVAAVGDVKPAAAEADGAGKTLHGRPQSGQLLDVEAIQQQQQQQLQRRRLVQMRLATPIATPQTRTAVNTPALSDVEDIGATPTVMPLPAIALTPPSAVQHLHYTSGSQTVPYPQASLAALNTSGTAPLPRSSGGGGVPFRFGRHETSSTASQAIRVEEQPERATPTTAAPSSSACRVWPQIPLPPVNAAAAPRTPLQHPQRGPSSALHLNTPCAATAAAAASLARVSAVSTPTSTMTPLHSTFHGSGGWGGGGSGSGPAMVHRSPQQPPRSGFASVLSAAITTNGHHDMTSYPPVHSHDREAHTSLKSATATPRSAGLNLLGTSPNSSFASTDSSTASSAFLLTQRSHSSDVLHPSTSSQVFLRAAAATKDRTGGARTRTRFAAFVDACVRNTVGRLQKPASPSQSRLHLRDTWLLVLMRFAAAFTIPHVCLWHALPYVLPHSAASAAEEAAARPSLHLYAMTRNHPEMGLFLLELFVAAVCVWGIIRQWRMGGNTSTQQNHRRRGESKRNAQETRENGHFANSWILQPLTAVVSPTAVSAAAPATPLHRNSNSPSRVLGGRTPHQHSAPLSPATAGHSGFSIGASFATAAAATTTRSHTSPVLEHGNSSNNTSSAFLSSLLPAATVSAAPSPTAKSVVKARTAAAVAAAAAATAAAGASPSLTSSADFVRCASSDLLHFSSGVFTAASSSAVAIQVASPLVIDRTPSAMWVPPGATASGGNGANASVASLHNNSSAAALAVATAPATPMAEGTETLHFPRVLSLTAMPIAPLTSPTLQHLPPQQRVVVLPTQAATPSLKPSFVYIGLSLGFLICASLSVWRLSVDYYYAWFSFQFDTNAAFWYWLVPSAAIAMLAFLFLFCMGHIHRWRLARHVTAAAAAAHRHGIHDNDGSRHAPAAAVTSLRALRWFPWCACCVPHPRPEVVPLIGVSPVAILRNAAAVGAGAAATTTMTSRRRGPLSLSLSAPHLPGGDDTARAVELLVAERSCTSSDAGGSNSCYRNELDDIEADQMPLFQPQREGSLAIATIDVDASEMCDVEQDWALGDAHGMRCASHSCSVSPAFAGSATVFADGLSPCAPQPTDSLTEERIIRPSLTPTMSATHGTTMRLFPQRANAAAASRAAVPSATTSPSVVPVDVHTPASSGAYHYASAPPPAALTRRHASSSEPQHLRGMRSPVRAALHTLAYWRDKVHIPDFLMRLKRLCGQRSRPAYLSRTADAASLHCSSSGGGGGRMSAVLSAALSTVAPGSAAPYRIARVNRLLSLAYLVLLLSFTSVLSAMMFFTWHWRIVLSRAATAAMYAADMATATSTTPHIAMQPFSAYSCSVSQQATRSLIWALPPLCAPSSSSSTSSLSPWGLPDRTALLLTVLGSQRFQVAYVYTSIALPIGFLCVVYHLVQELRLYGQSRRLLALLNLARARVEAMRKSREMMM